MSTRVSIIAIVASDGAIGRGGDQPFHISEDFKRFKALTIGKPIVMGRRTFEALPKGALPGRRNLVVTRQPDWSAPGAERAASLEEALSLCHDADEVMMIGGGEIYRHAMPLSSKLYITEVDAVVPDADTFFPEISPGRWHRTFTGNWMTDTRSAHRYRFTIYEPW